MIDTTTLGAGCRALLAAAEKVSEFTGDLQVPPGEWNADQILAHVAIVNATTIAAAYSVASGMKPVYDNRVAHDAWTINRTIDLAGGPGGLRERIRVQGEALCALSGSALSDTELDTLVPTVLVSNGALLVDQPMPLRDLIAGLAEVELPGHTKQLLALLPGPGVTGDSDGGSAGRN